MDDGHLQLADVVHGGHEEAGLVHLLRGGHQVAQRLEPRQAAMQRATSEFIIAGLLSWGHQ